MIAELLQRRESKLFLSFIVGFGLSVLMFHRQRIEMYVSALKPSEIRETVFHIDGKCYKFKLQDASCPEPTLSF